MLLSLQTFIVFSSLAVDGMCTDAMLQATAALTSLSSRTVPFLPQDAFGQDILSQPEGKKLF